MPNLQRSYAVNGSISSVSYTSNNESYILSIGKEFELSFHPSNKIWLKLGYKVILKNKVNI